MNLHKLQMLLGTLVVSLDDSSIEILTDICLFSIENKIGGFFIPANTDLNIISKFESHPQIDSEKIHENMIITIQHKKTSQHLSIVMI